jgi:hypothetical protein
VNFFPGSKNSFIGKTPRKPEDMPELSTGLMFHKYHLLNQLQVFMRYTKLPK